MKKHLALLTLAAGLLVFQGFGRPGNTVERPFWGQATVVWTVDLSDGSATGFETGVGTHIGLYENVSSVFWDLRPESFGIVKGTGTVTTADGEEIYWKMTPDQKGVVQIIGGTGRFAQASGALAAVDMEPPVMDFSTPGVLVMTITYTAAGTLVY